MMIMIDIRFAIWTKKGNHKIALAMNLRDIFGHFL